LCKITYENLFFLIINVQHLIFSFFFKSHYKFDAFYIFHLFKTDDAFYDSHIIISSIIQHHQLRIKTFILINNEIFKYVFIDVIFAQKYHLFLHHFYYFYCLEEFDDQFVLTSIIIHVIKITLAFNHYVEKMFLYVINLKQYLIVLSHSWLKRHDVISNFDNNILILISQFCLEYYTSFSVKIFVVIFEKK